MIARVTRGHVRTSSTRVPVAGLRERADGLWPGRYNHWRPTLSFPTGACRPGCTLSSVPSDNSHNFELVASGLSNLFPYPFVARRNQWNARPVCRLVLPAKRGERPSGDGVPLTDSSARSFRRMKEVMLSELINGRRVFLSTDFAGRSEVWFAPVAVPVSAVFFFATAPVAKTTLGHVAAFTPAYQSTFVLSDLIAAVLLFGQFSVLRSKTLWPAAIFSPPSLPFRTHQ